MTELYSEEEIRTIMKSETIKNQIRFINEYNAKLELVTGKKYAELEVMEDGRLRVFRRCETVKSRKDDKLPKKLRRGWK